MMTLTIEKLQEVLATQCLDAALYAGGHAAPRDGEQCQVCVRELRALALGVPWTDTPDGGSATDAVCQTMNDATWSSPEARTKHCLPLALLSEEAAAEGWVATYARRVREEILPLAGPFDTAIGIAEDWLTQAGLNAQGSWLQKKEAATYVACASKKIASTVGWGYSRDEVLAKACQILVECQQGTEQ